MNIFKPRMVIEGAGVRLNRSFPNPDLDNVDPFLLFDHFESTDPDDYIAGFPMHPHRGIETVTYMISGRVQHRDSLGNEGVIETGDVQWMTAGKGIMHEEMPEHSDGKMEGFQIWVNLPAKLKMTTPRYQEVQSSKIPVIYPQPGVIIKVIAGEFNDTTGPVHEIFAEPVYLDIELKAGIEFALPVIPSSHKMCLYIFRGSGFVVQDDKAIESPSLIVTDGPEELKIKAGGAGLRFLALSAKALNEPIARYGPFVMNTEEEIRQTIRELREGSFAKQ